MFASKAGRRRAAGIEGICVSSVVPRLNPIFREACQRAFGVRPIFATPRTIGIAIRSYNPRQVGADRLVNVLAAHERYRRAVVVVDIGTAITLDVVNARGEFMGGAIAPGPAMQARALHEMTAKLPRVVPGRTRRAIGRTTQEAIRSGIHHGTAGMIDRIVREISSEMGTRPIVVATGGCAKQVAGASETIGRIHPDLILEGLRLVWERNRR